MHVGSVRIALILVFLLAIALIAAPAAPRTSAEADGAVVIACELLGQAIDGDPDDAVFFVPDIVQACDGITQTDVANLANALGDEDDNLEPSDFAAIDQDANQLQDNGLSIAAELLIFAFVDNDATVTFDAEIGGSIYVHDDGGGFSLDQDANPETCTSVDDLDCDPNVLSDGDFVVVATVIDNPSGDPGDQVDIDVFQNDDTGNVHTRTISIVGAPDNMTLTALKNPLSVSADANDAFLCRELSDFTDVNQLDDLNRTFLRATVTDSDATELTRIDLTFEVNDTGIADFDPDLNEPGFEPSAFSKRTLDFGARGIGSFLVLCGGITSGPVTVTVTENVNANDADAIVTVVGAPATIQLGATPGPVVDCDGVDAAAIIATVTDTGGNAVADGTAVNFSVTSVGTVDPVNAETTNGVAITTFRGFSASDVGVPIVVTAGIAQESILMQCIGTSTDTDGDEMPNGYELDHPCLSANAADGALDPDNDNLSSHTEFLQSLDPCDADTDNDARIDGADNCPLAANTSQTNTDVIVNPPGDVAGDACDTNDDNDGCTDLMEAGGNPAFGGDRDPLAPWDFFDVPAPAGPALGQNGAPVLTPASTRNRVINLQDVGVVLAYVGRSSVSIDYAQDANNDGYADGAQLDRTPSVNMAKPWRSGPPNGAINLQDVGVALTQVGHRCTISP